MASGVPAWTGTSSRPTWRHIAEAISARLSGSPVAVVTPSSSHRGWLSRYASATASSMSVPMSVSNSTLIFSSGMVMLLLHGMGR